MTQEKERKKLYELEKEIKEKGEEFIILLLEEKKMII